MNGMNNRFGPRDSENYLEEWERYQEIHILRKISAVFDFICSEKNFLFHKRPCVSMVWGADQSHSVAANAIIQDTKAE